VVRFLPGLGTILGARVLGEFGDAPGRYATAKSRKNYAGTSPITRASALAGPSWPATPATSASPTRSTCGPSPLTASPGARAYYDQRRAAGDTHHQALRTLGNRLVGILHGCLASHPLRRGHCLEPPQRGSRPRCLTFTAVGCLAAAAGAYVCFEDEAGQNLRPPRARTWAPRGQTAAVRVSGKGSGRVSVAGLTCYKLGARSRLFYRVRSHRGRKGERRSMSEADYAHLVTAAHQQLSALLILVWDNPL